MAPVTDELNDDQLARIAAENEQRRLAYLYEATSALFGEPLDVGQRLTRLAQLVIPDMGDWCWIDLLEGDELRRVVTYHWNPNLLVEVVAQPAARPLDPRATTGASHVARTGNPELVTDAATAEVGDSPRAGLRSILRVPLRDTDRVVGVISLGFRESNREYQQGDVELVNAVAIRGGWAVQAARQYEVATRAIASRDDIMAVVAHDLRGPLATMLLGVDALRAERGSAIVDRIERAGARMEQLIADLLDWGSLESGHLRITPEVVSYHALVSDAVDALAPQASARQQRLETSLPDPDVQVRCDRARTFQVFANLVGNAIKFTPDGGRIVIRAEVEPAVVRFTVEDEGPGIAADHLPHVFERYWQADGGTEGRRGIGLGLAIASGIVSAQGGAIAAVSDPGAGARFAFTVPRATLP